MYIPIQDINILALLTTIQMALTILLAIRIYEVYNINTSKQFYVMLTITSMLTVHTKK